MVSNKQKVCKLLKGIETGDPLSVSVVNEAKYIQHNPQTHAGSLGLAELFKQLAKTSPRVNIVRVFEDSEYVFAHTEYDFAERNIGFEIFRFEDGQAVEHWDNIQRREGPNRSGHSMVDGVTEVLDHALTESNRQVVQLLVDDVLIGRNSSNISEYMDQDRYCEHSPNRSDDLADWQKALSNRQNSHVDMVVYRRCHRLLAEGNFVLSVCEGYRNDVHVSFFDLFRLANGMIVEHWDTIEAIPPKDVWKNSNGKF